MPNRLSWLFTILTLSLGPTTAPHRPTTSFHVSPTGKASGAGTLQRPWDLATALSGAAGKIQPGDTVWLHGGRYRGEFRTNLAGAPDRPIIFRQALGERATIDGTLFAQGSDLWFWGFEIMQSVPTTYGLQAQTNNGKFINLIIHNAGSMGISFWTPGENAEVYGCIVYHNGTHENQDHGVYVHNERGTKLLADNVFFENLAYGIHAYATAHNPPQHNIHIAGNISFNNGTISRRYKAKGNIIVGSDVPMSGMEVTDNLLFFPALVGENLRLGYGAVVNGDVVARGNFMWGGEIALKIGAGTWTSLRVENNTFGGAKQLVTAIGLATLPPLERANVYYELPRSLPGPTVFVRPNRYERGRAHVAIYNLGLLPAVTVGLSGVLENGQQYELRDVQNVFGKPVVSGTFTGDSVSVPVTGLFKTFLLTVSSAPSGTPR
ncbi:MAG TPA: right-handed parallel beta-helix repeat-containing protein [Gemmatimonadales bacterium]|nr:right-handed parallel beta-helix repeat-containing protein [Gemmatimonadales bacterium]